MKQYRLTEKGIDLIRNSMLKKKSEWDHSETSIIGAVIKFSDDISIKNESDMLIITTFQSVAIKHPEYFIEEEI